MPQLKLAVALACTVAGCTSDQWTVNLTIPEKSTLPTERDMSVAQVMTVPPGITVLDAKGLSTTASGGQATFKVVLNSQPDAPVTIGLSSSDLTQGTVSPDKLVLNDTTPWNTPQTVTVTGVDDGIVSGNHVYNIIFAPAKSIDSSYQGMAPDPVPVTNIETDVAGFAFSTTALTAAPGTPANFTVRLTSIPAGNVSFGLSSDNTALGTVSPATLTFMPTTWNVPQPVAVAAIDDLIVDGDQHFNIVSAAATSSDNNYNGLVPPNVSVTNKEIDVAGIIVNPTSGLQTNEGGGTATFTVRLQSKPTANVTIGLTSSAPTHGTVSPATLTFTPGAGANNWATLHTVTITGVHDFVATGPIPYTIVTAAAVSADTTYSGMNASDVSVTSIDIDMPGVTVSPASLTLATHEGAGGSASFSIVLNTQPTASVTIGISTSDANNGPVTTNLLTFTSADWNNAATHTVTVTPVEDAVVENPTSYTITTSATSSSDPNYNGLPVPDLTGTTMDDDVLVLGGSAVDWCTAGANCVGCTPTCSTNLPVAVPYTGGTVLWALQGTLQHGPESTDGYTTEILYPLTTSGVAWPSSPFTSGSHTFNCVVHTTMMTGTITVP